MGLSLLALAYLEDIIFQEDTTSPQGVMALRDLRSYSSWEEPEPEAATGAGGGNRSLRSKTAPAKAASA